ncbi:MAG: acetyltransferase [Xanthomonadales bacterium]|jgi:sugar O-acyltransferase (sialic acid O-acetyltransferase NeuD family)|nr:acetyltransferase [Xanthomonadales bacterium]
MGAAGSTGAKPPSTTISITILGRSAATLSMLLESLRSRGAPDPISVLVVRNVDAAGDIGDATRFDAPGVHIRECDDTTWAADGREGLPAGVLCGVYRPAVKQAVVAFFRDRHGVRTADYAHCIHPAAVLAASATLGRGSQVEPLAVIAPHATLGDFVSVNRQASVGHHTRIGAFSTLNPGVNVAGHCELGEGVTVGMGANIVDGIRVGEGAVVAAGALVMRDVPAGALVMGVPARVREPRR